MNWFKKWTFRFKDYFAIIKIIWLIDTNLYMILKLFIKSDVSEKEYDYDAAINLIKVSMYTQIDSLLQAIKTILKTHHPTQKQSL